MLGASQQCDNIILADTLLNDDKANQSLKEAWEQEDNKDELKIVLQGPERQFWLGKEAGSQGCNNLPGET